jgi:phenylacetate-CoA ligase
MLERVHARLSKHFMQPLFWRFKGIAVNKYYLAFRAQQVSSQEDYKRRQERRLRRILAHAVETVPTYKHLDTLEFRTLLSTKPYDCLRLFPVARKRDYRQNLAAYRSEVSTRFVENSSGGSTGEPVVIYQDTDYQASSLAATDCMFEWAGCEVGDSLVKLWGAERDFIKGGYGLKQKVSDFIGNRTMINAFNMSPKRLVEYVALINSKKPVCLEGYADSLFSLSSFIEERGLAVFSPKTIVSSAGSLLPEMRSRIERVFRTSVFDRYGCREVGNLASECKCHSGLHICGETSVIEFLNQDGGEVAINEEGRVIVTNFYNRVMPLIRYEVGDWAIKGTEDCACGLPYPLIHSMVGRSNSIFRTRAGGYISAVFFRHLFGIMCNDDAVLRFQIVQEDYDSIVIRVIMRAGFSLESWKLKSQVSQMIQKAMGGSVQVTFQEEDDIELTSTGKHLYAISKIQ